MDTLELIKALPPELKEQIKKEYVKIKLWQRKMAGWEEVNVAIKEAPFCERNQQIVNVLFCFKCTNCHRNGLCSLCYDKSPRLHYLGYPIYDENDYDKVFTRVFTTHRDSSYVSARNLFNHQS